MYKKKSIKQCLSGFPLIFLLQFLETVGILMSFFSVHLLLQLGFCRKDINPAFMTSQFVAMEFTMLSQTHRYDYMTVSNQRIKYIPSEKTSLSQENINGRSKSLFLSAEHQHDATQTQNDAFFFLASQSSQPDADRGITEEACNMPGSNIDLNQL